MVRSTLNEVLFRLPKLLKDRYGGAANAFWINKYNDLLGLLERTGCGPQNTIMAPIPWQMVASNHVTLPPGIADVTKLWFSTGGEIPFESEGGGVYLNSVIPTESEIIDMNMLAYRRSRVGRDILHLSSQDTVAGDAIFIHSGMGNSQPGEYNPNDLPKASWIISYTPSTEYMGVSGNPIGVPYEDGEYDWPINEATDFYWTFRDFLIVEGHRAYHRIAASTDRLSLGPEWDDMTEAYLRFRGEVQTDRTSKDSVDWQRMWIEHSHAWKVKYSSKPSSAKRRSNSPLFQVSGGR